MTEDATTRINRDAATANRIADALTARFEFLRLNVRYRIAHDAINAARKAAEQRGPLDEIHQQLEQIPNIRINVEDDQ